MEIVFKLRKYVSFTARGCARSICDHPFLVGFLCFLILFYRLSPFMFSLLVYVCPVFVSTAILLGTLLSFGQPNIPEIETDDKISLETAPIMIVERSLEVDLENVETLETGERSIVNDESHSDEEVVENHYVLIPVNEEHLDLEDESSKPDSSDYERADANLPSYPSLSSWVQVEGGNEEEEEDVDPSDSGSDLAESSSPGSSMAEVDSVLHELRPLLDNEIEDNVDSELDNEIEDNVDSEAEEDDDEEDERLDEEEEPEPVLMWTEEDHKNVMDLGNSETERNARLENLMMRMRARKNMRMMMEEMKLIDLESCDLDLPFNLTPIRTTRSNLYDLSHDFPDSAPPVLLPRRNPFDIPHDEEPSFVGGRLHEFVSSRSKTHLFRGQGRFNARPSVFAPDRQENKEVTEEYFEGSNDGMSEIGHEIGHISVGHGSQSEDEEEESLEDEVINRDVEFDKLEYSRVSSSSSLSEASERVYIEPTNQTITNEVIESVQLTEPVYDLSPTAVRNNISSSSISDIHVEPDHISTEGTNREMENEISITAILAESSIVHPLKEQQYGPVEFSNTREHEIINSDFLGTDVTFHEPIPPESFVGNLMDSDLGHVTLLNANNSPLSPDYVSTTPILSEASLPHVDQIIFEGTDEDENKDSDEEVMSELDSIIDFSIKQWEFVSTDYEEDIDLVAGSLFPAHDAQTSNLNIAEFPCVELNTMFSGTSENDSHNPIASGDKNNENDERYARNMNFRSMEDAPSNYEQVDTVTENYTLAGSGDHHIPHVLDSTNELLALEPMPLGSTNFLEQHVLDQDSTYGPLEVETHFVALLMDNETSAEASGVPAAAKLHNEDTAS